MLTPAEARVEMTRVLDALGELKRLLDGHDRVEAAINRVKDVKLSPLHTFLDHAVSAASRVLEEFIGAHEAESNPCFDPPGRDGGPGGYR